MVCLLQLVQSYLALITKTGILTFLEKKIKERVVTTNAAHPLGVGAVYLLAYIYFSVTFLHTAAVYYV